MPPELRSRGHIKLVSIRHEIIAVIHTIILVVCKMFLTGKFSIAETELEELYFINSFFFKDQSIIHFNSQLLLFISKSILCHQRSARKY